MRDLIDFFKAVFLTAVIIAFLVAAVIAGTFLGPALIAIFFVAGIYIYIKEERED